MSVVDQIQRLCEEYIGRKFGKRDKADLQEFLRGLQVQRTGDSDDEGEKTTQKYSDMRGSHTAAPKTVATEIEKPAILKESAPIAKKASAFAGAVAEAYSAPEPRGAPVKVSDFDDVEGVKDRRGKWEGGQVAHAEGIKQAAEGYKVDETEEIRARKQKWEEGQVSHAEGFKANVEGYKVEDTEEIRARKKKWEEGQVARAEGIKQPVEGYKVDETEELKARKKKWEEGQVAGAAGTTVFQPEGYKLNESTGVKDRLNKWSQVSAVPAISPSSKKPVTLVEGDELTTPRTRDRLKQWEDGAVGSPTRTTSDRPTPVKVGEGDVEGVKDRMNKWSEVTKEPEPSARKEPLNIYDQPAPSQ